MSDDRRPRLGWRRTHDPMICGPARYPYYYTPWRLVSTSLKSKLENNIRNIPYLTYIQAWIYDYDLTAPRAQHTPVFLAYIWLSPVENSCEINPFHMIFIIFNFAQYI